MLKLTHRYAAALLDYAEENGLELIYRQALIVVTSREEKKGEPNKLDEFLALVPEEDRKTVVYRFLDFARDRLNLLPIEIITAVELRPEQVEKLEQKLILMFSKQLDVTLTVDPSVLGGVSVIVGGVVLDDTIKRKIADMKESVNKGVYVSQ